MPNIDFSDITREDIIKAMNEYKKIKNTPHYNWHRESVSYSLIYNGEEFPHKYLVGIAYSLKYKLPKILESNLYNSTGDHKKSAQWCIEKNGFDLFEDKKFKDFLEKNYNNKQKRDTYFNGLKKGIKIIQKIPEFKDKKINEILKAIIDKKIEFKKFEEAQKKLDSNDTNDKNLFKTLKTKAKAYLEALKENNNPIKEKENLNKKIVNRFVPLNQILYGPPGTGKTYSVIEKAVEIIEGKKPDSREKAKENFQKYKDSGQIEFVTFHQSYSYEEFIEGLKAETDSEGNISYEIKDGIFKKISDKAKKNFEDAENKWTKKDFENVFREKVIDKLMDEEKIEIQMKRKKFYIFEITDKSIKFEKENGSKQHTLSINTLKKIYDIESAEKIISGGLQPYYEGLLEYLLRDAKVENNENLKNYVLIIDEINRGNISKIFGELITLIEPDKRLGAEEEMTVTLPYSKESFRVPKNLYIIGTMNTADRSIALLDTALRRRFEFVEMMPDPNKLDFEVDGINIKSMLESINQRIEYLYDRDHTIGHAYFMNVKDFDDLKNIFKNKIIPLLAEYFYDDWAKIRIVLADSQTDNEKYQFIKKKDNRVKELFGTEDIDDLNDEKTVYEINYDAFENPESYIKIYD
ncbi:McrB family protein [Nitrosophilus alvini]|uniref:McrB family protein n=1 Tax=Nitrosophilus alvini TaxID=2714855 RepID=UPI0023DD871D|nr:AAA family ATPase [Nitrosophilus alvini]